ncbi:Uncharacterised protein [Klebsiella pneumoniae]|uniref:Uncharacterized protein n=3 Tax=Enterobacteriaceae TaxID=543 RepID=A0A0M7JFQ6_ENTCL|nr:hypothetical protein AZ002_000787 [Citrobacter freundii]CUJ37332.1 Uncharacterised protein [Enterobacter cloacae]STQ14739.1 Uncharacterised protein [Enterobacter cloacae]SVL68756.1 Uncharacterised protein [Klebsiella pneumoniae]SYS61086.1 Uncharacterised protein [Klebsiella pneumoniae]
MSIMLILASKAASALAHVSESLNQRKKEWFTNQSGHSSFRPEVIPDGNGFTAIISRRTGYSPKDWTYQRCATAGRFASSRQAMNAGRRMAQQLADLRYRFD